MSNNQENGNAAAMREALKLALSLLDLDKGCSYKTISQKDIDFIKSALTAPPRNCDIGTAEEQTVRFRAECYKNFCNNCRFGNDQKTCGIKWSQTPYEAEEGAGK